MTYGQLNAEIPISVGDSACLASDNGAYGPRLYVTGGDGYHGLYNLQVLDLGDTYTWLTGYPSMNYGRRNHGCIVHHETLYVMGTVTSIETYDISRPLIW